MGQLFYKTGDLFSVLDTDPPSILAHACNARGSWGSGIAAQFKYLFPEAYRFYQGRCRSEGHKLVGTAEVYGGLQLSRPEPLDLRGRSSDPRPYYVGCLFTSYGYGANRGPELAILRATGTAVADLLEQARRRGLHIHSPAINSGLFGVPWEKTANLITSGLVNYPEVKWTVWKLPNA